MAKYLVDSTTGLIKSGHKNILDFSISGSYVIDVPDSLGVVPESSDVADLITAKNAAFAAAHPLLTQISYDEHLATTKVDSTYSSRYMDGTYKRTALLPNGGSIVTDSLPMSGSTTTGFVHLHAFLLESDPSTPPITGGATPPDRLMYNYSVKDAEFVTLGDADVTIDVRANNNGSTLATLASDVEGALSTAAPFVRLRFTNNSTTKIIYISDWIFLSD